MPNPLEALKKASSIGADPDAEMIHNPHNWTRAEMPLAPGAIGGMTDSLKGLFRFSPANEAVMESMYQRANPVFRGLEESGAFSGSRTINPAAPVRETLGELNPEFTPTGGEGLYNIAKAGLKYVPKGEDLVRYLGGK